MSDSENTIKFVCPQCGSDKFKTDHEPKTFEDMLGAKCADCGASLSEDDIKTRALKIAEDRMRKAFGEDGKIHINIDV
jgi:predicted RNA-binding Zn-ribbon protein involved in translation (DUF1610 family)